MAEYLPTWTASPNFDLHELAPKMPRLPEIPMVVRRLSARFTATYRQAITAEASDLTELTGMGLRKALEFLVKDYAIARFPDEAELIKPMALSKCIRDYIKNPSLRDCAERATWLGNDETHYLRLWVDRDVGDLKILISLTIDHVATELLAESIILRMPAGTNTR